MTLKQHTFVLIFVCIFTSNLWGDDVPNWVEQYESAGAIQSGTKDEYYGVGVSKDSQGKADDMARVQFQKMVQVWVEDESKHVIKDVKGEITQDDFERRSKVVTAEMMHGISIKERYFSQKSSKYYSLIRIGKDEFQKLHKRELKLAWEREKAQIEAENRKMEALQAERLRHEREEAKNDSIRLVQNQKKIEARRNYLANLANLEADFLGKIPNNHLVTMRNGVIRSQTNELMLKAGISPVSFEYCHFATSPFSVADYAIELFMKIGAEDGKINNQEGAIRFQLLPYDKGGKTFRTAVAFGFAEYSNNLKDLQSTLLKMQTELSPMFAMNIALPMVHTHVSAYGDSRKLSLGGDYSLWYDNWKGVVSLIVQSDLVYNANWRNKYNDPVVVQGGVHFRPSDLMNASLTYENHDKFVFSIKFMFKPKRKAAN